MKSFLIVTADDFGLHEAINEAVEQGARRGVLTAASLMVGAPAAADAVLRARLLPHLAVGLHVVLADGQALLPPDLLPDLCDGAGWMDADMFVRGVRYFAIPRVRRQLEAEMRAQFAAFARTGLPLDHINAHKHFHVHPTLLGMMMRIGRDYGAAAMRVPAEPLWFAATFGERSWSLAAGVLIPSIVFMKQRLRAAGLFHNDRLFGVAATGAMDEPKLLAVLDRLPAGVSEIYLHPAMSAVAGAACGYRHTEEFAALLSPRVRAIIYERGIRSGGYADAARACGQGAL